MRVFVTGATGSVGSAIIEKLLQAGHQVLGLARSAAGSSAVTRLGAEIHRGDLTNTEILAAGARQCDGVIHTAYNHDFTQFAAAGETDRRAVKALGSELAGTGKPMVVTFEIGLLTPARPTTEDDEGDPHYPGAVRMPSEKVGLRFASQDVRSIIIRLPIMVHDRARQGFPTRLVGFARQTGVSAYIGDGVNHWPAVHRLDAADLFRLALEHGAAGSRYHAIAESDIS
jgi:nucleoside-diphosphate-sugar epimerase